MYIGHFSYWSSNTWQDYKVVTHTSCTYNIVLYFRLHNVKWEYSTNFSCVIIIIYKGFIKHVHGRKLYLQSFQCSIRISYYKFYMLHYAPPYTTSLSPHFIIMYKILFTHYLGRLRVQMSGGGGSEGGGVRCAYDTEF